MSAGGDVPVIECVRAAYGFLAAQWRNALVPALAPGATFAIFSMALSAPAPSAPLIALSAVAFFYARYGVFAAAALRAALGEEPRLVARFGAEEGRVLGAKAAVFGVSVLVAVAGWIALAIVLTLVLSANGAPVDDEAMGDPVALAEALGATGQFIGFLGILMILAALVYVEVRLVLVGAATVGEKRLMVFATWPWTHGNGWRIFAALALAALLPSLAVWALATLLAAPFAGGDPLAAQAISGFIYGVANAVVVGLLAEGLAGYLYRGLRPAAPPATGAPS